MLLCHYFLIYSLNNVIMTCNHGDNITLCGHGNQVISADTVGVRCTKYTTLYTPNILTKETENIPVCPIIIVSGRSYVIKINFHVRSNLRC